MSQKTTGSPPIRLSIVIPVYNSPEHVRTAVEIAASQTCEGGVTEVIVVDDGSTDETPTVLAQLEGEHTNLRVIRQENSGWAGAPRNAGLDVARGDYVFFHDADDRLNGDCLGSAVATRTRSRAMSCSCGSKDEEGAVLMPTSSRTRRTTATFVGLCARTSASNSSVEPSSLLGD